MIRKSSFLSLLVMLGLAACIPSGSACPAPSLDTELLTNTTDGYCLLYTTKYSAEIPGYIVINPIDAPGDQPGEAWLSIAMEPGAGRTAAQVADEQIALAGPGFNITRDEVKVGGEQAVVVDGLPGPDPWRKVFVVHENRLYTLTFQPWQPSAPGTNPTPLEGLYATVMNSLHFLPVQ
jgi:hypothetical protein